MESVPGESLYLNSITVWEQTLGILTYWGRVGGRVLET